MSSPSFSHSFLPFGNADGIFLHNIIPRIYVITMRNQYCFGTSLIVATTQGHCLEIVHLPMQAVKDTNPSYECFEKTNLLAIPEYCKISRSHLLLSNLSCRVSASMNLNATKLPLLKDKLYQSAIRHNN